MKTANVRRAMTRSGSYPGPRLVNRQEPQFVPTDAPRSDPYSTYAKSMTGIMVSFLFGFFTLWLSLTIQGVIGLGDADRALSASISSRIIIASALALIFCIVGLPLILPWFVAFLPAYFLIPVKSVFWKSWVCTLSGVLVGVLALWFDALVYSLLTAGPSSSLNIPLLKSASIPAAVLGGAVCFAAAIARRMSKAAYFNTSVTNSSPAHAERPNFYLTIHKA